MATQLTVTAIHGESANSGNLDEVQCTVDGEDLPVYLQRSQLHQEWLGFAIAAGQTVSCAAIARLEGPIRDRDEQGDETESASYDVINRVRRHRQGFGWYEATFGDGRNATWHWVNLLTLGFTTDGDGGPSSFADAVKWSREEVAADATCATSVSPADSDMTQQRDKRAASLRYRARERILWDLYFEKTTLEMCGK
jgi:hypothetical protein